MFLQSIPSPSGFTRRRPWLAWALVSCLLVANGLCDEVTSTTRPNLNPVGSLEGERWPLMDTRAGNGEALEEGAELDRRAGDRRTRSVELIARQVTGTPSSASLTTTPSNISPGSTTLSPSSAAPPASASTTSASASSTSSSPTSTSTAVPAGYELPRPFDSTLGTNFTSTACPSFFATFLADPEFISCAPFSLLLGTSSGFFQAQRSPSSLLPFVLNSSCSAPADACSALMDKYARQIKLQNTCGQDLAKGNPLAQEALEGFQNYRLYREVGCQRSNATQPNYCFVDASANPDPDSLYFYYLAEGTSLPSGTVASCDYCLQNLLASYSRYAVNSTLPISKTYSSGRSVAALTCGPNFAPIISKTTSAAHRRLSIPFVVHSSFWLVFVSLLLTL
ncbi:hypothetical protein JCM11491_001682 [Sporobolomyces phaffii]